MLQVNFFTLDHQLIFGPGLADGVEDLFCFCLLFSYPKIIIRLFNGMNNDRHEAMVFAAQLCALTAIYTRLFNNGPGFVNKSGNSIPLHCEVRYPEGVDRILRCDEEPDTLVDRNHQRVINIQQIVLALCFQVLDFILWCFKGTHELNFLGRVIIQIGVLPLPLIAANFDIKIRIR